MGRAELAVHGPPYVVPVHLPDLFDARSVPASWRVARPPRDVARQDFVEQRLLLGEVVPPRPVDDVRGLLLVVPVEEVGG